MRQFFVTPENITGSTAVLTGQEARHISTVLHLSIGTAIILFDGSGTYYEAVLSKISLSRIEVKIISIIPYIDTGEDLHPGLHLALGLLKGKKIEFVIQKTTELGIAGLHPFHSRYCVAKDHAENRLQRWQKIALEACKQCNRPKPPDINPTKNYTDLLSASSEDDYDVKLIFWENKKGQKTIREIFTPLTKINSAMILIGPEGGFSNEEVRQAIAAGYEPVTMGSRILRAETAAIAAVSIIQHELGNLE